VERYVYLSLGTNLGDKPANLRHALEELEKRIGPPIALSGVYESEPWGFTDQPSFLNMCALFRSDLEPVGLLEVAKGIEKDMGRTKSIRWGPRLIDIDILKVGKLKRQLEDPILPHPRMWDRAFVIVPLLEISKQMKSPAGEPIRRAAARLDPDGKVKLVMRLGG